VADANWSDDEMPLRVCQWVVPLIDFSDDGWWIIDDTGFPKQGRHSVGVARQYCGMLGKQDNCQVAVSVSLACEAASVPVAWQLYLPKEWAEDPARRDKAGVPETLQFATKPAIALQQIEHLMDQGAPRRCVLADAGYGVDTAFRERLSELALRYVVGVTGSVTVWPPGREPLPPAASVARGYVGTRLRLGGTALPQHHPQSIKALALELGPEHWHTVTWREGWGGVSAVSDATGMSPNTIRKGLAELGAREGGADSVVSSRLHRPGGGRKRLSETDPQLSVELDFLVDPLTRGDPESPLRWTCKSTSHLAQELSLHGHPISARAVAQLLNQVGYGLQGNRKTLEGTAHPDRNAQFEHINVKAKQFRSVAP
jgi:hypothetical protein